MNETHTVPQSSSVLKVLPVAVAGYDDRQSSPPPLTVTAVHAGYLPQHPMHDNHPIPLGLAQQNEIPMDISTLTNPKLHADCDLEAASGNSGTGIVKSSLCSSNTTTTSTNTSSSEAYIIDNNCKSTTTTLMDTSLKRLNIVSNSVTSAIPSYIKIGSAQVVPKHHIIQSTKGTTSIPIEVPVSGKNKFTSLSTLARSEGVQLYDSPQLVFPTTSTHFTNKTSLLTPPSHRLVSAGGSVVPALIPVKNVGQPKHIPINVDSAAVAHQPKKMRSVLIPSSHLKKQVQTNRYINVKISNGQVEPSKQATFKFVHNGKPLLSSSKMKLMKPQSTFKLNSIKSHARLLPKFTPLMPITTTTTTSEVSNYTAKKSILKSITLLEKDGGVRNLFTRNDTDVNQDLNRCLQEAVESMFSPCSPTSSSTSYRSTGDDKDDVTLIKLPALSATSTQQEDLSVNKDPDDVKIELINQEASTLKIEPAVTPIKKVVSSQESQRARPDSTASCQALVQDKQIVNHADELPISAADITLMPGNELKIQTETLVADVKSLTVETLITDAKQNIESTTLTPVHLKLGDNRICLNRNDLKIQRLNLKMPMESQTAKQPNESVASHHDGKPEALADGDKAEPLANSKTVVPALPENEIKFSVNEFGLIEIDTDSNDKDSVKSKFSENSSHGSKSCKFGIDDEKRRTDSNDKESVKSKFSENSSHDSKSCKLRIDDEKRRTDSNDKESVKSKFSENSSHDSKSCKLRIDDEKRRTKSKIGILCKKVRNSEKKLRYRNGDTSPEKLSRLNNDDMFAKKKKIKKKIKSPMSKATESTAGTTIDGVKSTDDIYHCDACGCYGLEAEFLSSRFCSSLCEEDWTLKMEADIKKEKDRAQVQLKRRKKKLLEKVHLEIELQKLQDEAEKELQLALESNPKSPKSEPEPPGPLLSEPSPQSNISKEETSNDGSQDSNKPRLPWQTGKHGFSWTKYLEYNKAKPAPVKLFKDPFPYSKNNFKVGMRLEGIDPKHPNYFCVLSVAEVCGFRLKLHFDGYSSLYDFWINADSMDIFPAGWCERNGYTLHPPPTYDQPVFNWSEYLKHCRGPPAPKSLFYNKTADTICPNGFRIGMKLEAVDRQNTSLVCVASVVGLMDSRIMVHFDGWDDIYNYWADPSSSYIHPVGWCEEHGHKLTPPSGWERSEFNWEDYLQETKTTAAPARAFKQRVLGGFKRGLKLECVDKRMPMVVRVATVDDIREHQIRVKFDGWSDIYSYWVDEDSRDIHPMGWCQTVGHVLELPLTCEDYTLDCPTPECHGQGHVVGSKHLTNHTVPGCPFDPQILIKKEEIPDRLTSTPENPQVCIKEKRLGETKNPIGRPPKWRRQERGEKAAVDSQGEMHETDFTSENKRKKRKISRTYSPTKKIDMDLVCQELRQAVLNPGYKPCGSDDSEQWLKHSYPLNFYISSVSSESDFTNWSEDNVIELITSISNSEAITDTFKQHGIDGEAFSMMTQDDLVSFMGIKIGPALKIFNCIMLLRQKARQSKVNLF